MKNIWSVTVDATTENSTYSNHCYVILPKLVSIISHNTTMINLLVIIIVLILDFKNIPRTFSIMFNHVL